MKNSICVLSILFCIISTLTFSQDTVKLRKEYLSIPEIVTFPEVEAEFPGGNIAMKKFIAENVVYPREALDSLESGKVYVEFIVTKNGMIADARVIRSISPLLDAESLRVVNLMPRWIPATLKGKNVASRVRFPISYHFR